MFKILLMWLNLAALRPGENIKQNKVACPMLFAHGHGYDCPVAKGSLSATGYDIDSRTYHKQFQKYRNDSNSIEYSDAL